MLNDQTLEKAIRVLRNGGVVIFPTETVYGIGVMPFEKDAIERVYDIKKRPHSLPLTLHISSFEFIRQHADILSSRVEEFLNKALPGPVTAILPRSTSSPFYPELKTLGFRFPADDIAVEIIAGVGGILLATSVNISGAQPAANLIDAPKEILNSVDYVVDTGQTRYKTPSTICNLSTGIPTIMREGVIKAKKLFEIWEQCGKIDEQQM